jgi:hypothetical protein
MNNDTDNRDTSGQQATEHATTVDPSNQAEPEQEPQRQRRERRALMAIARRDQSPLNAASAADALTLNHNPTTTYSSSAVGRDDEFRGKQASGSVYSYRSGDLSQFVKTDHGR